MLVPSVLRRCQAIASLSDSTAGGQSDQVPATLCTVYCGGSLRVMSLPCMRMNYCIEAFMMFDIFLCVTARGEFAR